MRYRYRSVAFLVELLINILVFCVSCAILVALFGRAGGMAGDARRQGLAAAQVNALVESLRADGEALSGTAVYAYGEDWQPADGGNAAFTIRVETTAEEQAAGTLVSYAAVAAGGSGGEELYRLETKHYLPRAQGGGTA